MTWSDIYTFDLALVNERPLENLVRKAFDARAKYRSIAGQKEYDEYLASKPPDLTAILIKPGVLKSGSEEAAATPTATPTLNETQRTGVLQVKDFLKETGPKDGVSFALLMIWSFIAGFAERLVPDTLNRLVAKTEAIQGTNS